MEKREKKQSYFFCMGIKYWVLCIVNCLLTIAYLMFVYGV